MKKTLLFTFLIVALILASCGQTTPIKIYFSTDKENPNFSDCSKVEAVEKTVPSGDANALARAALEQLFAGPGPSETTEGARAFWLTDALYLNSVKIENETAYVDWKDIREVIPNASTSCGSASFLAPIENTLKQFSGVTKVVQSIKGDPKTFYEWLQLSCQEGMSCSKV